MAHVMVQLHPLFDCQAHCKVKEDCDKTYPSELQEPSMRPFELRKHRQRERCGLQSCKLWHASCLQHMSTQQLFSCCPRTPLILSPKLCAFLPQSKL